MILIILVELADRNYFMKFAVLMKGITVFYPQMKKIHPMKKTRKKKW